MKPILIYKFSCYVLFLLILSSCSGQSQLETALTDYESRLSRVLDMTFEHKKQLQAPFPTQASIKVNIPSIEINLREFYAIKHCRLAALVAERNSALGKAQLPSQRFLYEHNLLKAFDECAQEIAELQPTLADKLIAFKNMKQENFPLVWAKLVQQSQETYSALSRKNGLIQLKHKNDYAQALQDWKLLLDLKQSSYSFPPNVDESEYLENALKRISSNRLPATLLASQVHFKQALNALNYGLEQSLPNVQCPNGKASQQAEILRNVFVMFFVEQLQPIGSQINALHYEVNPIMTKLSEQLVARELSSAVTEQAEQSFHEYQASIHAHVSLWRDFFKRCNLTPTR